MRDNKAIGVAAGVVALASVAGLAFFLSGGFGPSIQRRQFEAVGRALARQTIGLHKPAGRITVIARDTATFQNPASDCQLDGFREELARAGVKIDSIQSIQIDPLRPSMVPPGDFLQWIKKGSKGDVIVSFMGPPVLTDSQIAQLGPVEPAIVAFCSGPNRDQVDLRAMFARGLLQAAVVSKPPPTVKRLSGEDREAFHSQFVEVTSANLTALTVTTNSAN